MNTSAKRTLKQAILLTGLIGVGGWALNTFNFEATKAAAATGTKNAAHERSKTDFFTENSPATKQK